MAFWHVNSPTSGNLHFPEVVPLSGLVLQLVD
jgi:hypothetical protein